MLTWHYVTKYEYDTMKISEKTSDKLFFLRDTKEMYCGLNKFRETIVLYKVEPVSPVTGKLYIDVSTLEGKIWSGSKWITAIYPIKKYSTDVSYIEYDDVNHIEYDSENNNLKVYMNDGTENYILFNNFLLELLYSEGFMMDHESCYLNNGKKINIGYFIDSISYENKNIIINFSNSNYMIINVGGIIDSSTYDITAITITGNSFIAESMIASNDKNECVYKNEIYVVSNTNKANYSPISRFSLNNNSSNVEVLGAEEATDYAVSYIAATLEDSIENKMNKVGMGFEGEIIVADNTGNALASGVKIGSNNMNANTNHTLVPTEKAVVNYIENNVVTKDDVSTSDNMPTSEAYASDDKVVSEKGLLSTMGWHIL